ncbi:hypothetical protein BP6252_09619 [Coleophoma cylindrospora]|uniref:Uncharacterized protein n=1 Tax=Coleophoma cylindrospora TaxID=1849047 RepID=A0A3D8QWS2_9HELO|nr:hypothetical protein BP6252_09619 [Coleophoma cylindrospora]
MPPERWGLERARQRAMERAINWQIAGSAFTPRCDADAKACIPPVDAAKPPMESPLSSCASCAGQRCRYPDGSGMRLKRNVAESGPSLLAVSDPDQVHGFLRSSDILDNGSRRGGHPDCGGGCIRQRLLTMQRSVKGSQSVYRRSNVRRNAQATHAFGQHFKLRPTWGMSAESSGSRSGVARCLSVPHVRAVVSLVPRPFTAPDADAQNINLYKNGAGQLPSRHLRSPAPQEEVPASETPSFKMQFIKTLLPFVLAAGAIASPIAKRDASTVVSDLSSVTSDLNTVDTAINGFTGGLLQGISLLLDFNNLKSAIDTATSAATAAGTLSTTDSTTVTNAVVTLVPTILTTITDIEAKASVAASAGYTSDILSALNTLRNHSSLLFDAIVAILDTTDAATVGTYQTEVYDALTTAIADF